MTAAAIIALLVLLLGGGWLYTPDKPRAELEAQYARPGDFQPVAGLRLHVRDTGPRTAPPVIFLHGFASSLHTWEDWARSLEGEFRVIRFDLPGFGLTGPDPSGDYTDARSMAVILSLMDRLELPRASLVGSSMGGRIAWTFAATHPARVDRLVLMAPDGFASPGRGYGTTPSVPLLARVLPYTLPASLLRSSLAPAYANPAVLTQATLARYRDMLLVPGNRQAILVRMAQGALVDPVPLLRRIEAPTLLLWGQADAMVPVANAADYTAALRDSRVVTLPGIGHVPMEEAPAETVIPLRDFLRR
ncbi:alpha/beta hydrolase [Roseomonas stagni]|uniref:Alpha/beta hydrolase n=1 Tax=Falsiroseomonas algicola TaxID=2716930 RepID=A0A6M1LM72_9PROT|nr:alpha/beta hydrolase [Falsiroseomonas algicola]NGM20924.1 alpha/beta hydrolase [Falsiroseomonas algicola]